MEKNTIFLSGENIVTLSVLLSFIYRLKNIEIELPVGFYLYNITK